MKDRIARDREIQRYAKTNQKPSPQTSVHHAALVLQSACTRDFSVLTPGNSFVLSYCSSHDWSLLCAGSLGSSSNELHVILHRQGVQFPQQPIGTWTGGCKCREKFVAVLESGLTWPGLGGKHAWFVRRAL